MTVMTRGMMSSDTDEWATPQDLFDRLNAEFSFDLDVCATRENHKCSRYYTKEDDGLSQKWEGTVWMNSPYGRVIGDWVAKAYEHGKTGVCVCLVPARTDTRWWHDYVMKASEIRLYSGRLCFGKAKSSAPFPSALVVFGTPRMTDMPVLGAIPTKVIL